MNRAPVNFGIWHKCDILNLSRETATARVGHNAHYIPITDRAGWILLVCGANIVSCCKYFLLFDTRKGKLYASKPPTLNGNPGFERYEQSSAIFENELVIFGGATPGGPHGDIIHVCINHEALQNISESAGDFFPEKSVDTFTTYVEKRTQHSAACVTEKGEMIIFSGGGMGSFPVKDQQVHLYKISEKRWSTVECTVEDGPSPRMGHLMLYHSTSSYAFIPTGSTAYKTTDIRSSLYVHGGMVPCCETNGEKKVAGVWRNLRKDAGTPEHGDGQIWPSSRAGHGGAVMPSSGGGGPHSSCRIFIFGGVNGGGALNDLAYFDEANFQWTDVHVKGSVPPQPRFDFAFTTFRTKVCNPKYKAGNPALCSVFSTNFVEEFDDENGDRQDESMLWRNYLFIHGGMDAGQNIFNDAYIVCMDA